MADITEGEEILLPNGIRSWATDISTRVGQLLGHIFAQVVDIVDSPDRELGEVTITGQPIAATISGQPITATITGQPIDVEGTVTVEQDDPDSLRADVNLQILDHDVDNDNPVPVTSVKAVDCSPNDTASRVDDIATVTYAAATGISHLISGVGWSYSEEPTNGRIYILDGIETVFDLDITNAGPGFFLFDPPKRGRANRAMIIALDAGGCRGKLSVLGHWTE